MCRMGFWAGTCNCSSTRHGRWGNVTRIEWLKLCVRTWVWAGLLLFFLLSCVVLQGFMSIRLATTFFVFFLSFNRPKWWTSLTGLLDPLWSLLTCPTQTTHRYGMTSVCIIMYQAECACCPGVAAKCTLQHFSHARTSCYMLLALYKSYHKPWHMQESWTCKEPL